MKRFLMFATGVMLLIGISLPVALEAQVYSEFDLPYKAAWRNVTENDQTRIQFYDITAEGTVTPIGVNSFFLPPNQSVVNKDDGYAKIPIGFTFEFNGYPYNEVWVCINGFVTFVKGGDMPPFVPSRDPQGLFISSSSYPDNVVAPFWGDHYFRTDEDNAGLTAGVDNLYTLTNISYCNFTASDGHKYLIIQWKDLNINYKDPVTTLPVTSSVATFQVIIHEQIDGNTKQGDIEFAYGPAGADLSISRESKLITFGASIGLKGDALDFVNGLVLSNSPEFYDVARDVIADSVRKSVRLSGVWQPSNGTDTTIYLSSNGKFRETESWGDGDVDFSKTTGQKHFGMQQNRFVTVNDAWNIMRSVATRQPLDSILYRQAFHGDVNHNGRYFYDFDKMVQNPVDSEYYPTKVKLPWRDKHYSENLDNPEYSVPSLQQLYFEVNELDASVILMYLSARVPQLPYLLDTMIITGRVINADGIANGVDFGKAEYLGNGYYSVPVYLNGNINNFAMRFDLNAEVTGVEVNKEDGQTLFADYNGNRAVVIGDGNFTSAAPIFYVTVRTEKEQLLANDVTFNEVDATPLALNLTSIDNSTDDAILSQNMPNPFSSKTTIMVNVPETGVYTLNVYDILGNKVKEIVNTEMQSGSQVYYWDAKDTFGNRVNAGTYIYTLTGKTGTISKKLIVK